MKVKLLTTAATLPQRVYNSAGYDLFAAKEMTIIPGTIGKVSTQVAVEIPKDHVGFLKERSSRGSKGQAIRAGVIDADYRDEIMVCIHNLTAQPLKIKVGDKIAQMVVMPIYTGTPQVVDSLSTTERGTKGFGSTGDNKDASIKPTQE